MKEFCNFIKIIPVDNITHIYNNNVYLLDESIHDMIYPDDFTIEPQPEHTDSGTVWVVNQNIIIEKLAEDVAVKYMIRNPVIMVVYYSDGNHTVLGCKDYPVQLAIIRNAQKDIAEISLRTTLRPVL